MGAFLVNFGCTEDPAPDPRFTPQRPNDSKKLSVVFVDGVPVPAASASALAGPRAEGVMPAVPAIGWEIPTAWQSVQPSSPVRLGEYHVPALKPDGETGEVSVFYLGQAEPSIDDTLQRWARGFDEQAAGEAKRWVRREGIHPAHGVEVVGTFRLQATMGAEAKAGEDKPGWMLIGVIVVTPEGPYYFKLLGPQDVIEGAREVFLAMIDSVGRREPRAASSEIAPMGSAVPTPPGSDSSRKIPSKVPSP